MSPPFPALPQPEDIKLVITDVDGTLLTDEHAVHPRTRSAIRYIRQKHPHIQIVVATGKQRHSCQWFIDELDLDASPAAACHGSILHGPHGAVIKTLGIGNRIALQIAEEAKSTNLTCFLFTIDGVHLVHAETSSGTDWAGLSAKYDGNVVDEQGTNFLDRVQADEVPIIKATVCLSAKLAPAKMAHFSALLPPTIRVTRALPFIIEIVPAGVDKGVAFRHFCGLLDCKPENVIAFGDGENDIELLAATPWGVAMGNAMPAAAEAARHRTLTNNEGGVGAFLDKVFRPGEALKSPL